MLGSLKYVFFRNDLPSVIRTVVFPSILCLATSLTFAANASPKAVWYRYYDQHGTANISTSVTPAHIRFGYEALDQNMQVIQRNRPYSTAADLHQAAQRATQTEEHARNLKLKQAYGSSKTAALKRDQALQTIKKQINYQQEQLNQLQRDKIALKRQEMEYFRKGEIVPKQHKALIENNATNIINSKDNLITLKNSYFQTQTEYEQIIKRLKKLE